MRLVSMLSTYIMLACASVLMMNFAFATEAVLDVIPVVAEAPTVSDPFIALLLQSLGGGWKGLGVIGIVTIVAKLILSSFDSVIFTKLWAKASSGVKLLVSSGLSYVLAVCGLLQVGGISVGAALVHSTVAPLLLAFLHKIYTVYIEKKTPEQLLAKAAALTEQAKLLQ